MYSSLLGFVGASLESHGIHGRHLGRKGSARAVQVVLTRPQGAPVWPPRLICDESWSLFWCHVEIQIQQNLVHFSRADGWKCFVNFQMTLLPFCWSLGRWTIDATLLAKRCVAKRGNVNDNRGLKAKRPLQKRTWTSTWHS